VAARRATRIAWPTMADYRPPLRDLAFVLAHLVDIDALARLDGYEHSDLDTVLGLLEENGRFVAGEIAPLNRVGDLEGTKLDNETHTVHTAPGFKEAYARFVEAGWGGVPFPESYGGGGFPWVVGIALQELLCTANTSFSMAPFLTQGAIELLMHHGSEEQQELYVRKMVTGEWTGTMNLTESQAGSDVGALRTKAVKEPDGTYRITGTKIFISFGDHDMADNVVHLVLARTPDAPPGTKGISCFIVPKYLVNDDGTLGERNDVVCISLEHKMGIRASPTCVMSYGEQGGAIGYLVGEENQGMRYMFTMMNNARLSVGLQGLALAERAYQDALDYAQERRQGRAPGAPAGEQSLIIDHPDVRRMLLTMKTLIDAMRAIVYVCAESIDLAAYHPDESVRADQQELVDLLIPVAKAWSTDMAIEVTSLAIQVYGGMGYIEESGVPQHYRDARITAIYEGTNGIQAMDLVGRKLGLRGGAAVERYLANIRAVDAELEKAGPELAGIRTELSRALDVLVDTTRSVMAAGLQNPTDALAAASPYLRMFSLVTAGWLMARQALAALDHGTDDPDVSQGKVTTARFFCEQLLPEVHGLAPAATAPADQLFALDLAELGG
jgi:alkylation response protein AidB-like acyl-CoA dehydrogenase